MIVSFLWLFLLLTLLFSEQYLSATYYIHARLVILVSLEIPWVLEWTWRLPREVTLSVSWVSHIRLPYIPFFLLKLAERLIWRPSSFVMLSKFYLSSPNLHIVSFCTDIKIQLIWKLSELLVFLEQWAVSSWLFVLLELFKIVM